MARISTCEAFWEIFRITQVWQRCESICTEREFNVRVSLLLHGSVSGELDHIASLNRSETKLGITDMEVWDGICMSLLDSINESRNTVLPYFSIHMVSLYIAKAKDEQPGHDNIVTVKQTGDAERHLPQNPAGPYQCVLFHQCRSLHGGATAVKHTRRQTIPCPPSPPCQGN